MRANPPGFRADPLLGTGSRQTDHGFAPTRTFAMEWLREAVNQKSGQERGTAGQEPATYHSVKWVCAPQSYVVVNTITESVVPEASHQPEARLTKTAVLSPTSPRQATKSHWQAVRADGPLLGLAARALRKPRAWIATRHKIVATLCRPIGDIRFPKSVRGEIPRTTLRRVLHAEAGRVRAHAVRPVAIPMPNKKELGHRRRREAQHPGHEGLEVSTAAARKPGSSLAAMVAACRGCKSYKSPGPRRE